MHRGRTHTMEMDEMEEAERTTWTDVDDPVEERMHVVEADVN